MKVCLRRDPLGDLPADGLNCKESYDLSDRHTGHFNSFTMAHISF